MPLEGWKSFFEIGGVVLLFLTFAFGAGALITSGRINSAQEERLRQFDKGLTDAKTELGRQEQRAAIAESQLAGLQKNAADAKIAQQNVEIDLAKQQERAANAEQALLQLQRRTEPRRITADQRARLIAALSVGPKGQVEVDCSLQDCEACAFAQQILDLLIASGWSAKGVDQLALMPNPNAPPPFNGPPAGLWVEVRSANPPPDQATALQKAFFAEGIAMQGTVVPSIAADSVLILVAPKPQI